MKSFVVWMEYRNKDFSFFKNMVLGKLNLDRNEGMSTAIDSFQKENLKAILDSLGEFKDLPQEVQDLAMGKIRTGDGTIGDLIRVLASKVGEVRPQGEA